MCDNCSHRADQLPEETCLCCLECVRARSELVEKVDAAEITTVPTSLSDKSRLVGRSSPKSSSVRRARSKAPKTSLGRSHAILCLQCSSVRRAGKNVDRPHQNRGVVECAVCHRNDLGKRLPLNEQCSRKDAVFFHCVDCDEKSNIRYDLCDGCARHSLQCPSGHQLFQSRSSPYEVGAACASCDLRLREFDDSYHCVGCWRGSGIRTDRCVSCTERHRVEFTIDSQARFQLLSREVLPGNLSWTLPGSPTAAVSLSFSGMQFSLLIRMHIVGFVFPIGSRLCIGGPDGRDATVVRPSSTGAYEVRFDGECDLVEFEPSLSNHSIEAVWRYAPGQRLAICTTSGWIEARVVKVDASGNRHLVESRAISGAVSERKPFYVDLNTCNHSPLWLSAEEWGKAQRHWQMRVLARCSSAYDALTGAQTDVMQLLWNVSDAEATSNPTSEDGPSESTDSVDGFAVLLSLVVRSPDRGKGHHRTAGHLIIGEPASGKSQLLQRLATEACRQDGEMVPVLVRAVDLVSSLRTVGRHHAIALRLAREDFLLTHLRTVHGEESRTLLFLRQALHARRALVLVDAVDCAGEGLVGPLLSALAQLAAAGHRLVATAREHDAVPGLEGGLRLFRLQHLRIEQQKWIAQQRLGEERSQVIMEHLKPHRALGLVSTVLMFQLFLRYYEVTSGSRTTKPAEPEPEAKSLSRSRTLKRAKRFMELDVPGEAKTPASSEVLGGIVKLVCQYAWRAFAPVDHGCDVEVLRKLLQMLALQMTMESRLEFTLRDITDLNRTNALFCQAWDNMEVHIRAGRFSLVCCSNIFDPGRGKNSQRFRFSHPGIQHFLACKQVVSSWKTQGCPVQRVEDMLISPQLQCIVLYFAEQHVDEISLTVSKTCGETAVLFARFLALSQHVSSLSCPGVGIGQHWPACREIARGLMHDQTIRLLDLRSNGLGSEGVRLLCRPLQWHPALEKLVLQDNHISHVGASHVAAMLRANRTILDLDLAENTIGDVGVKFLADALCLNPVLEVLHLQRNDMSVQAADELINVLQLSGTGLAVNTSQNRVGVPVQLTSKTAPLASSQFSLQPVPSSRRTTQLPMINSARFRSQQSVG